MSNMLDQFQQLESRSELKDSFFDLSHCPFYWDFLKSETMSSGMKDIFNSACYPVRFLVVHKQRMSYFNS